MYLYLSDKLGGFELHTSGAVVQNYMVHGFLMVNSAAKVATVAYEKQ